MACAHLEPRHEYMHAKHTDIVPVLQPSLHVIILQSRNGPYTAEYNVDEQGGSAAGLDKTTRTMRAPPSPKAFAPA